MIRVGWLGLGAMGVPMARCLQASGVAEVTAYDRSGDIRAGGGVGTAASAAQAARDADLTVVMVRDAEQVRDALFGVDGAGTALRQGSDVVVMSTIGPQAARELAERLADRDVSLVDAPVSGGVARAAAGDLVIMAGAADGPFERCRPVLEVLGSTVVRAGGAPGDGQAVKLVNQLLCGVHIAAAAEALAYAESIGLDPAAVWETVRGGAAGSFMLDDRGSRMVARTYEPVRSAVSLFVKDLGLVQEQARLGSFPVPLASTAAQLFSMAAGEGLREADDASLIELFRRWGGAGR